MHMVSPWLISQGRNLEDRGARWKGRQETRSKIRKDPTIYKNFKEMGFIFIKTQMCASSEFGGDCR